MPELIEVELPVCPQCGVTGKIPGRQIHQKTGFKCMGPEGQGHRITHMEMKLFREVPREQGR